MSKNLDRCDQARWNKKEKRRRDAEQARLESAKKRAAENMAWDIASDQDNVAVMISRGANILGAVVDPGMSKESLTQQLFSLLKGYPRFSTYTEAIAVTRARAEAKRKEALEEEARKLEEYRKQQDFKYRAQLAAERQDRERLAAYYDEPDFKNAIERVRQSVRNFQGMQVAYLEKPRKPDPMLETTRRFRS